MLTSVFSEIIHIKYSTTFKSFGYKNKAEQSLIFNERVTGIEPVFLDWQPNVLPLYYTRFLYFQFQTINPADYSEKQFYIVYPNMNCPMGQTIFVSLTFAVYTNRTASFDKLAFRNFR